VLFERGQHPKIVQSLLGHSSITQTMDTYSHLMEGMGSARKRSLRDRFAGAFRHGEGGVGDLVASFLAATASSSARSFPLL
jgi:hypothetical protein